MKRLFWALAASVSMVLMGSAAHPQSLLYKPAAAVTPNVAPPLSPNCNVAIPFTNFVGKKIVFLAKTMQFQRFGYQSWHFDGEQFSSPTYQDLAGKIGTVMSIDMSKGAEAMFKSVVVRMDDTGKLVTTQALDNVLSDIILLNDIDFVKSRYVGKTVWIKTSSVRANQDVEVYDGVKVRKFSPVKIIDAVPGTFQYSPIDFVIETESHQKLLVPSSVSASNVSEDMLKILKRRSELCDFDREFSTEDPRAKYKWPEAVWHNIEMERVVVGMTLDQVIMAKGDPQNFNETKTQDTYSAQLVYPDNVYVYINEKNIVTAVQE